MNLNLFAVQYETKDHNVVRGKGLNAYNAVWRSGHISTLHIQKEAYGDKQCNVGGINPFGINGDALYNGTSAPL